MLSIIVVQMVHLCNKSIHEYSAWGGTARKLVRSQVDTNDRVLWCSKYSIGRGDNIWNSRYVHH